MYYVLGLNFRQGRNLGIFCRIFSGLFVASASSPRRKIQSVPNLNVGIVDAGSIGLYHPLLEVDGGAELIRNLCLSSLFPSSPGKKRFRIYSFTSIHLLSCPMFLLPPELLIRIVWDYATTLCADRQRSFTSIKCWRFDTRFKLKERELLISEAELTTEKASVTRNGRRK